MSARPPRHGGWTAQLAALAGEWLHRLKVEEAAHATTADRFRRQGAWIAITIIVISAVVGSTFFRSAVDTGAVWRLFFGTLSLMPGVLTAIQKLLQLSERAEKHAAAARRYRSLRRKLEVILGFTPEERGNAREILDQLQRDFDEAEGEAPEVTERVRVWAEDRVSGQEGRMPEALP